MMGRMLTCERLEPRTAPAASLFALQAGALWELAGGAFEFRAKVFDDASITGTVAAGGDRIYVGAGPGGGPHVKGFDGTFHERLSVFVGDPDDRRGVPLAWFDRPSIGPIAGETPAVRMHLDRVPPLTLDTSALTIRVVDPWDRGSALGYYHTDQISLRPGHEHAVLHELGHWVDERINGGFPGTLADAEARAWAFVRWVNGEPNAGFDALRADRGPFVG